MKLKVLYFIVLKNFFLGISRFEAGTYNYPFRWILPYELPSSTTGRHGFIQYEVKVYVSLPKQRNLIVRESFNVIRALNLNEYPNLRVRNLKKKKC